MRTKTLLTALAVLAAVAALAGCASMDARLHHSHAGCDDPSNPAHVCRVTITVDGCSANGIHANPDTRYIPPNGTWVIQWTLATQGYEFADDGINFPDDQNPGGILTKRGKTGAATYVWVDQNMKTQGPFKYKIHILKNGAECASKDPDVYND